MGIPGTKIQFLTEAHETEVSGLSSINCPYCQDTYHCKVSIWRDQRPLFSARDDFFSVGSVYFVGMRSTIVKMIQPSLIKLLSPKLSSAIKLGFDMASVMCKLSAGCLRSSYRLHRWVLCLSTTVSDTDLVCYNACIMLSGPANAGITTKPIFSFFCNAPIL